VAVKSKSVIVATGGFNSNLEMVLRYNPTLRKDKVLEGSGRGSTGTGHELIRRAGGYLTHMDHIWFYVYATPDYRAPRSAAVSCSAWCPATYGSISRAAGSTTSRCRAATPLAPR
jgi:Predicted oxidoreductase